LNAVPKVITLQNIQMPWNCYPKKLFHIGEKYF